MIKAVIFDLDGVLVTTDDLHFEAWKKLGAEIGIHNFTKEDNVRQRGIGRMESLEILLEKTDTVYSEEEKIALAEKKNNYYKASLESLSQKDVLPGALEFLAFLKEHSYPTALGSASKNAPLILEKTGLFDKIDAIACGLDVTRSKPDPQVFLVAADKLGVAYENCLVVEDSDAGIEAAKKGGMYALAVGAVKNNPDADFSADDLSTLDYSILNAD
ncbi:MAG: beta-phosphoglucomutase [Ruminococcaceae bacterium]|nr:beta-phosphoglucomutase [Oscillospiraceae bacterium]